MKLSLSWICDHLNLTKMDIDVDSLVERLTARTAEIDGIERVRFDKASWYAVQVKTVSPEVITLHCPELKSELVLSGRTDASVNERFLVLRDNEKTRWVTLADTGSLKDGLLPRLFMTDEALTGSWRSAVEQEDALLVIDNKALTNRPDLWSHRGFAREIGALLGVQLKDEQELLKTIEVRATTSSTLSTPSLIVERLSSHEEEEDSPCKTLAALSVMNVTNRPSSLWMAMRLARVDTRPHSALIDMTNYVLFDLGQPMHAFDADTIAGKTLKARFAVKGEVLTLLDDTEVTLHSTDYVIADSANPLLLAGIMGGRSSMVTSNTAALIIEAGTLHPAMVRRTATAFKKRTESSTRFEKGLDPSQPVKALQRYLALMDAEGIAYETNGPILLSADPISKRVIAVAHQDIEQKIGIKLPVEQVTLLLESLGFVVVVTHDPVVVYTVTVPSWRATKDVTIEEDIIEEVARLVGYDQIVPSAPYKAMIPFDISKIERSRMIKKFLAFGLSMREIQTYAFFDESFLRSISYDPQDALRIANPLSEHWQRLVTSLVPHLLEAVRDNRVHYDSLRFFELQRVWFFNEGPVEEQEYAGIWYEKKKNIDFYEGKELLTKLFDMLHLAIEWRKPVASLEPWYAKDQSAELWYRERLIGTAGKADFVFLRALTEGEAFIFELDANFLLNVVPDTVEYKPAAKYPTTTFDLSVLIDLEYTVASLESLIKRLDERISSVMLMGTYEKPEWLGKKSLTFRCTVSDPQGTLTKEVIDSIRSAVIAEMELVGGEIR